MSDFSDSVGGKTLYGGLRFSADYDRFGNQNSAFYFFSGYLQVPSGVYIAGDYTIIAWIYLKSYQKMSRIIELSNGQANNNIIFSMNNASQLYLCNIVNSAWTGDLNAPSSSVIDLYVWYHVVSVFKGTTGSIYVNGVNVVNGTQNAPANVTRIKNQ